MSYQTTYQAAYGSAPGSSCTSPSGVHVQVPGSPFGSSMQQATKSYPISAHQHLVAAQQYLSDDEALALAIQNADREEARRKEEDAQAEQQALALSLAETHDSFDANPASGLSLIYPSVGPDFASRDSILDRRLSRLPSLQLKPRVNSDEQFWKPHISDDRARLLARLEEYSLVEREVEGDGSCQFRSLSDQLYGNPEHHDVVRRIVVEQLHLHPEHYKQYVPQNFKDYVDGMSKPGTWGDHVTLKAASDAFGVRVVVLTSFKESFVMAIDPGIKQSNRVLWLSFWAEVHYNSLYPKEEPPGPLDEPLTGTAKVLGSKKLAKLLHMAS